jgi:Carboxypeptidase regulatory-like domain
MRFRQSQFLSGFLLLLVCAGAGLAQNATGAITGTVTDPNNDVVSNATITVTNKATGAVRKVTTKGEGNYTVENLIPGEYEVRAESQGFITQLQVLLVQVGASTTGNFSMSIGAASQTIEVTGGAPVINTTDTVVGGVVNREAIENLPLNGRSFLSVALLEPGVTVSYNATSGAGNVNNFFQVSVGGAPQSMTLISVDGARVNDRVTGGTSQNFSAETVQEFQIQTNNFDLSSGTVATGAINIVSRTGTNQFHGSGFFFFRDHNMAAFTALRRPTEIQPNGTALSPFCANPTSPDCKSVTDPFFVRRQYGGSVGGPIKKDKLFFFVNYERADQVGANTITFSDPALLGFNHVAKQPFKQHLANVRLDYTLSQKHTAFLRSSVDANDSISGQSSGLESLWIKSSNFSYQENLGVTSVLKPTLVNDLRFSYAYFRNFLDAPSQAECEQISSGLPFACFGLGGVRLNVGAAGNFLFGNSVNVPQDRHQRTLQLTDNVNWTLGTHRVRFGGSYEYSYGHGTWNQNYQGQFTVFSPTQVQAANPALYAALPTSLKTGIGVTIQDLLKLPMGGATTPTLTIGIGDPTQPAPYNQDQVLGNHFLRFYGQDAWQIRSGFTLNYGLGWSFESNILYHDLDLPAYLTPIVGADKIGKTIPQRLKNFDPALGFAWALGKEQKTVLRASASLHHVSPNVDFFKINQRILFGPAGNGLASFSGSGLPNPKPGSTGVLNFTTPTTFTAQDMITFLPQIKDRLIALYNTFNGKDLTNRGINFTKTVQGPQLLDAIYDIDSSKFPYTINFDVGVQREIMRNLSVSVDFVMRRGVGFGTGYSGFDTFYPDRNRWNKFNGYTINPTTGVAIPGARTPVIPACTPAQSALIFTNPSAYVAANCSQGPIQYGLPGIFSRYSAMQVKVDKRFSRGFQLTGAYSFAKYTTLASISNNNDLYEGFGPSSSQPRHRMTASAVWDLPNYNGKMRLLRGALSDWQLSTIMQMQSGTPTSVTLPGTLDIDGDGTFVNRLPGTGVSSFGYDMNADDIRNLVAKYNASVPAAPTVLLQNVTAAQRDALGAQLPFIFLPDDFSFSDSFLTHDLRVTRIIPFSEKVKLQLIAEGFNIFNIANLNGFSGTLNALGRATAANGGVPTLPNGTRIDQGLNCSGPRAAFVCGLTFGQPTGRVSPIFGSGGPRAFQLAARLSF